MQAHLSSALDETMLLSRVSGNRSLAVGLLREFYVTHADVVHRIRAAIGARADDDAFRLLHRTAGTAANLGLAQLAAVAARAERVIHDALRRGTTIVGLDLDAVERCLNEALAEILAVEARLNDSPGGQPVAPPGSQPVAPMDAERLAGLMARLAEDLQAARLEALDRTAILASHMGPEAEPLSAAVARLDFVEAAGILRGLQQRDGDPR